jgi:hypothetical protein
VASNLMCCPSILNASINAPLMQSQPFLCMSRHLPCGRRTTGHAGPPQSSTLARAKCHPPVHHMGHEDPGGFSRAHCYPLPGSRSSFWLEQNQGLNSLKASASVPQLSGFGVGFLGICRPP